MRILLVWFAYTTYRRTIYYVLLVEMLSVCHMFAKHTICCIVQFFTLFLTDCVMFNFLPRRHVTIVIIIVCTWRVSCRASIGTLSHSVSVISVSLPLIASGIPFTLYDVCVTIYYLT